MLKRILFLIPLLFCLSFHTSLAGNWEYLSTSKNTGEKWYYETDTIRNDGSTALVWTQIVARDNSRDLIQLKFYKSTHSFTPVYSILYGSNGQKKWSGPLNLKNMPISPDTAMNDIYNFIWDHSHRFNYYANLSVK